MEQVTYDDFKRNFGTFCLRIIKVKKYFFKKYILFEVWDNVKLEPTYVEKCTSDLKKMYASIKEHFPNFPITDKHEDNIAAIMSYAKDDWAGQHYFILEFLYAFLFKSKSHANIERPKQRLPVSNAPFDKIPQSDSFSDDQSSLNLSSNILPELSNVSLQKESLATGTTALAEDTKTAKIKPPAANIKLSSGLAKNEEQARLARELDNKERLLKVFQKLFQSPKSPNAATFPRVLLFEKKLLELSLNKQRSELFSVKFKFSNEQRFVGRYAIFTEKMMFLYENGRDYIRDRDSFLEAYLLLKIDKIAFTELPDGDVFVELSNESNLLSYQIVISSSILGTFLLTLCVQLIKKESAFIKQESLPRPFNCVGDFILKIEERSEALKTATEEDRIVKLNLSFFELLVKNNARPKRIILPILNHLDLLYVVVRGETQALEMTDVYDLPFNSEQQLLTFPFLTVSARRVSDYVDAFTNPILENYHEATIIEAGFKKSIKELEVATFRLKRLFAFRDFIIDKWTEFLCFKYPLFTIVSFIFGLLFVLTFSVESFMVFVFLSLLFYFNPFMNAVVGPMFDALFFRPTQINKSYVAPRNPPEKMKRKAFYLSMDNIEKRYGDKQKLREKLLNAFDFSARVPQYIHCFVDFFEKIKNIFLWRSYRKTEASIFYLISLGMVLYFTSKEAAFVYWVSYRVWYGRNYYRRILKWNTEVLYFLINYFISDHLGFETGTAEEFFIKNRTSLAEIMAFSKEFSKFVEKWLDVKLTEDYWKNHFSLEEIVNELLYSHKRIILPFYEEKRKPGFTDQMQNFIYSTPSDLYYALREKAIAGTVQQQAN